MQEDTTKISSNSEHQTTCGCSSPRMGQGFCVSKWNNCGHKRWLCMLFVLLLVLIIFCAGVAVGSEFRDGARKNSRGFYGEYGRPMMLKGSSWYGKGAAVESQENSNSTSPKESATTTQQ